MSKDLPYFRFHVSEWLNDDISLESYQAQGVFISVCSYYWFQDCSITIAKLKKRFSNATAEIEQLLSVGIIDKSDDGFARIKFLDKQYDKLSEKRKKRVEAGRKGGLARASNAKANVKQSLSYKDKDKEKEKDNSAPPDLEEVREYFSDSDILAKDVELEAEKFINYYEDMDWRKNKGKGKRIDNWHRQAGTWIANYKQYNGDRIEEEKKGGYPWRKDAVHL